MPEMRIILVSCRRTRSQQESGSRSAMRAGPSLRPPRSRPRSGRNIENENKNRIIRFVPAALRCWIRTWTRIVKLRTHLLVALLIIGMIAVPALPQTHAASGTYFDNIVVVAMENQDYASVMGTGTGSSNAPFIASMLAAGATIPLYHGYGAAGRSINGCSAGCYTALISGSDEGISDGYGCCINAPTLMDSMASVGMTWQAYCESGCPRGNDHFPFTGFSSIHNSPGIFASGSVSTANFVAAASSASPSTFLWFTPTDSHNMHDNSIQTGDTYLRNFLVGSTGNLGSPASGSLFASNLFQSGHRTLLLLWWDEYDPAPILFFEPGVVKQAYVSSSDVYDEYSILHLIEDNWGLSTLRANDAAAASMTENFGVSTPPPSGGSGEGSGGGSSGAACSAARSLYYLPACGCSLSVDSWGSLAHLFCSPLERERISRGPSEE